MAKNKYKGVLAQKIKLSRPPITSPALEFLRSKIKEENDKALRDHRERELMFLREEQSKKFAALCKPTVKKYHSDETLPDDFSRPQEKGSTLYFSGEGQDGIEGRIVAIENFLGEGALSQLPNTQLPIIHLARKIFRLQGSTQLKELQTYLGKTVNHYKSLGLGLCPQLSNVRSIFAKSIGKSGGLIYFRLSRESERFL